MNRLEKIRRDWERGLVYWQGENDDGDQECQRCLTEHLPTLLKSLEAAAAWRKADEVYRVSLFGPKAAYEAAVAMQQMIEAIDIFMEE